MQIFTFIENRQDDSPGRGSNGRANSKNSLKNGTTLQIPIVDKHKSSVVLNNDLMLDDLFSKDHRKISNPKSKSKYKTTKIILEAMKRGSISEASPVNKSRTASRMERTKIYKEIEIQTLSYDELISHHIDEVRTKMKTEEVQTFASSRMFKKHNKHTQTHVKQYVDANTETKEDMLLPMLESLSMSRNIGKLKII